jgi:ABC-2 type transport system permease protein
MAKKEVTHLIRNRRVFALTLFMPLLLMTIVGLAFAGEVKHITTVIVNRDGGPASQTFIDALKVSETLRIRYYAEDEPQAEALVREGLAKVVIVIPSTFEDDVKSFNGIVYVMVDGSDPVSAGAVAPVVQGIALGFTPKLRVQVELLVLYNPSLRYIDFIAPAIVGIFLQIFPMILISMAIAGERERGTIEQLIATPVSGFEILIGKLMVYMGFGFLSATTMLVVAVYAFNLVVRGSVLLIALFLAVFLTASLSLGTLVSAASRTQMQAVQTIMPVIYIMMFLSGTFYPIEAMSPLVQPISYVLPLTYMIHALRSIIVKGAGLGVVTGDFIFLSVYTIIMLVLAVVVFHKKLE